VDIETPAAKKAHHRMTDPSPIVTHIQGAKTHKKQTTKQQNKKKTKRNLQKCLNDKT
jgi:hypothetical protein